MSTAREIDSSMGKIIRLHRYAADLTQNDLGEAAGVKFQQVQKYEAGTNRVSVSRLFAIADALRIAPAKLIALVQEDIGYEEEGKEFEGLKGLELLSDKNIRAFLFEVQRLKNPAVGSAFAKLINELQNCSAPNEADTK